MNRVCYVCSLVLLLLIAVLPASASAEAVSAYQLVPSAKGVVTGDTVSFTLMGKSLADVYGADIELDYDATKLAYTNYASQLGSDVFVSQSKPGGNKVKLLFTYHGPRAGLSGDANLFTITFKAIEAGEASVQLIPVSAFNSPKQPVDILGSEAKVTIADSSTTNPDGSGGSTGGSNPGSTGSTGGGNFTGVTTNNPSETSTPGVIQAEAQVSAGDGGIAVVNIQLNDLLAAAKTSKDQSVVINVKHPANVKVIQVDLPAGAWQQDSDQANLPL